MWAQISTHLLLNFIFKGNHEKAKKEQSTRFLEKKVPWYSIFQKKSMQVKITYLMKIYTAFTNKTNNNKRKREKSTHKLSVQKN